MQKSFAVITGASSGIGYELAAQFARQVKDTPSPTALIDDVLGSSVSTPTREAITRAESREQAFALLLMSPEFQRR